MAKNSKRQDTDINQNPHERSTLNFSLVGLSIFSGAEFISSQLAASATGALEMFVNGTTHSVE
jgi:hypothetical protein